MGHHIHHLQRHHIMQPPVKKPAPKQAEGSFKDILAGVQELKVSKHAKERLNQRNITISDNQWHSISEKMEEAKRKGVTDSLVITDSAALLVSTKNNTVVTAMNRDEAASRIFTNINGTILINE